MARGRFLSRETGLSKKIAALEAKFGFGASVFHHRLLAFLDRNGNVRAKFGSFKDDLFPRQDKISVKDCEKFTRGLIEFGLAELYEVDGLEYLHFPDFTKFQQGLQYEKEKDEYPALPEHIPEKFQKNSGNHSDKIPAYIEVEDKEEDKVETEDYINRPSPPDGGEEPLIEIVRNKITDWNKIAPSLGLKQVQGITQNRKDKVQTRNKEPAFNWQLCLEKIKTSNDFARKNFLTFDWVLKSEANYTKLQEGNYDVPKKDTRL